MLNNLNSERIMYWTKITGNFKVVELLKKREEIEKEIQKLDSEALINYELEKLAEPQANDVELNRINRIMTGNELYAEYCNEYPIIQGYREVPYESWLQQQVIEYRTQVVNNNVLLPLVVGSAITSEKLQQLDHKVDELLDND